MFAAPDSRFLCRSFLSTTTVFSGDVKFTFVCAFAAQFAWPFENLSKVAFRPISPISGHSCLSLSAPVQGQTSRMGSLTLKHLLLWVWHPPSLNVDFRFKFKTKLSLSALLSRPKTGWNPNWCANLWALLWGKYADSGTSGFRWPSWNNVFRFHISVSSLQFKLTQKIIVCLTLEFSFYHE